MRTTTTALRGARASERSGAGGSRGAAARAAALAPVAATAGPATLRSDADASRAAGAKPSPSFPGGAGATSWTSPRGVARRTSARPSPLRSTCVFGERVEVFFLRGGERYGRGWERNELQSCVLFLFLFSPLRRSKYLSYHQRLRRDIAYPVEARRDIRGRGVIPGFTQRERRRRRRRR